MLVYCISIRKILLTYRWKPCGNLPRERMQVVLFPVWTKVPKIGSFFILLQILLSLKHVPMQHYQSNKCDKSDGSIKVDNYTALSQWTSDSWKYMTAYQKMWCTNAYFLNTMVPRTHSGNVLWRWNTCNASSISRESPITSKCETVFVLSHRAGLCTEPYKKGLNGKNIFL